ncbi:hypothetical protein BP6252_06784 [Coleophoma cylindrospora]|uniref:Enoyl reductase (ER) domain-containing protein n=1 Tax=Coleophoma cylindrospora TaxID=1849047 RepID=A0A3D8RFQ7_9HELO|nr:hypothetical protein BP6252_06784 [Coleophoma cylindrospora]
MKAINILEGRQAGIVEIPKPKLRDDYILVKINAVGLNSTDVKHIDWENGGDIGSKPGCDYCGIVEEIGPKVTKPFRIGDRITGFVHGSNRTNKEDGAFSEWAVVKGDIQIKVPDRISNEEAATLGAAISTVGQGLYKSLRLPRPNNPANSPFPVLIYGGSTTVGIYGIQFAKLSGLTVITTASPHNFDFLRSLGADAVFDYRSPTCVEDIKKLAPNLEYAWDTIGDAESCELCAKALDSEWGDYGALQPVAAEVLHAANPNARGPFFTTAFIVCGETYEKYNHVWERSKDEFEFAKMFWDLTCELLAEERLKPTRISVNKHGSGLEGVLAGLEDIRANKVSGQKLIYTL